MKKLISIIMLILLIPMVLAEYNTENEEVNQRVEEVKQEVNQRVEERKQEVNQRIQNINEKRIQGIENALDKVQNEIARENIQRNLNLFQERLNIGKRSFSNITIEKVNEETSSVIIVAKQKVRYLGFIPGKSNKIFNMDSEGDVSEKNPWYRFLYREERTEE